jgi:hypothetical protein
MTLGSCIGALAGGVVFFGGVMLVGILSLGHSPCVLWPLTALIVLVVYFGVVGLAGMVSASCTTYLGRWGKNRSDLAASHFSAVSGLLGGVVGLALFLALRLPLFGEEPAFGPPFGGWDVVTVIFTLLGALPAALVAMVTAFVQVGSAKFCEDCERYMKKTLLKRAAARELRDLATALKQKDFARAANLLREGPGEQGRAELFTCPSCSHGYLELKAVFKVEWEVGNKKEAKSESWLIASVELSPDDLYAVRSIS